MWQVKRKAFGGFQNVKTHSKLFNKSQNIYDQHILCLEPHKKNVFVPLMQVLKNGLTWAGK